MATLQKKSNGYYYIRYYDENKKQRMKATGTKKAGEARSALAAWIVGEEARIKAAKIDRKTLREATPYYENFLRLHRKEATQVAYKTALHKYFLPKWGDLYLDEVKAIDIDQYLAELSQRISTRHCNTLRINLQGFYRYCVDNEWCAENPVKKVPALIEEPGDDKSINLEHAWLIMNELEPLERAIFATLYFSGLRIGEVKGATLNDFDSTNGMLYVRRSVYKRGRKQIDKTGKPFQKLKSGPSQRDIRVPQILLDILKAWRLETRHYPRKWELMFPHPRTGEVFDEDDFREKLTDAAIKAAPKVQGTEPLRVDWVHPHIARAGFARLYLSMGGNIRELQRTLGHSRIQTTMKYLRWGMGYGANPWSIITDDKVGKAVGTDIDKVKSLLVRDMVN